MTDLTRVTGALTATYGVAALSRPSMLARQSGLPDDRTTALLSRALGARDLVSGAAMVLAPPGPPRLAAAAARVTFDAFDALGFGIALRGEGAQRKVVAVAAGWGLLCLGAALYDRRRA